MRSSSSAASLALLALAASSVFAAPRTANERRTPNGKAMPLSRRHVQRSVDDWGQWAKNHRDSLTTKYGGTPSGSNSNSKRGSGTNLIVNQNADSTYFGSLAIGEPPVAFDVILDTGSADLWIADSSCTVGCEGVTTFDASASSSFNNLSTPFSITYGSGQAAGQLAQDTVQMAGFSVSNQTFALCDQISDGLLTSPVSGLLGLAFQTIASSGATPIWENLVQNGAWDDPLMSFFLTRFVNSSQAQAEEAGGAFTMGFTNSSYFTGDIEYQSLVGSTGSYWLLEMSELTVQGNSVSLTSGSSSYAAIDTGTTLVGGPSDVIAEMYAQIPNSQAGSGNYDGYYFYPCDTDVTVTVAFGGSTWSISPADFELTRLSQSQCLGAFFVLDSTAGSSTPAWIVGDTFLKNVYSVFRYNPAAVGFAQLSDYAKSFSGDLDAEVPTPTLGSVAAAITATGSSRGSSSSSAGQIVSPPTIFGGMGVLVLAFLGGLMSTL